MNKKQFWNNVRKTKTCWIWKAWKTRDGYGRLRIGKKKPFAHRVAYELIIGIIPKDKFIDHLCRNRLCVNPYHMEVVTLKENVLRGNSFSAINSRKTHCINGHEFTPENTYNYPNRKHRACKTCMRNRRYGM